MKTLMMTMTLITILSTSVFAQGYPQEQYPNTPNQGWNGWQPVYDQEFPETDSKMRCHILMSSIRPYVSSFAATTQRNYYSRNNGPMHVQSVVRACGFNKDQMNPVYGPFQGYQETLAFTCYPQKALVTTEAHLYYRGEPVTASITQFISSNNNYQELPWEVPTNYLDKNTLDYVCSFIRQ
jgi:hypothetical protein